MDCNCENEIEGGEQDFFVLKEFEDLDVLYYEFQNSSNDDGSEKDIDEKRYFNNLKETKEKEYIVRPKDYRNKQKKSNHKLIIFDPKNKKIKNKRKRKDMEDNKRKKIKSNFYSKYLNKELNNLLKDLKVQKKFSNLSQVFIANVTKKINKRIMNLTLKEHMLDDSFKLNKKMKKIDIKHYENNKKIITYLENKYDKNIEIINFLNMKMRDIFIKYFQSDAYKESIQKLINKGFSFEYIDNYREVANDFVSFFS
jgi:hypothetical protein